MRSRSNRSRSRSSTVAEGAAMGFASQKTATLALALVVVYGTYLTAYIYISFKHDKNDEKSKQNAKLLQTHQ